MGVVGAGWWSCSVHLPALAADPDAELVGVCDQDAQRARRVAEMFGAGRAVTDVQDLLDLDLDAVVVATPHDAHHAPAAAALDAGVDVLVEKPMVLDPVEGWDLVARAERSGAALHVGYTFPYSDHADRLRGAVTGGELGELHLVSALFASAVRELYAADTSGQTAAGAPFASRAGTYTDPARGGGQLFTQMTHAASLVLWATDLAPATVSAAATRGGLPVDLADVLSVTTHQGCVLGLASTGSVHDDALRQGEYQLFGSHGQARLDTAAGTLVLARRGRPVEEVAPLTAEDVNPVRATAAALVATAVHGAPVRCAGELGARTAELLAAAARSAADGATVVVPHRPVAGVAR